MFGVIIISGFLFLIVCELAAIYDDMTTKKGDHADEKIKRDGKCFTGTSQSGLIGQEFGRRV